MLELSGREKAVQIIEVVIIRMSSKRVSPGEVYNDVQ